MKKYQLFLDESGGFIEVRHGKSVKKPNIVAEYLSETKECTEKWAKSIFRDVKNSDSRFAKIYYRYLTIWQWKILSWWIR